MIEAAIAEGEERGKTIGEAKVKMELAKGMQANGISKELIKEITGITGISLD